jgi:hypothetical protein
MAREIDNLRIAIARPTEVGTWVDRIAGDTLKRRALRIAEIESTGSFSRSQALAVSSAFSQAQLESESSSSRSRSGLRPRDAQPSQPSHPMAYPAPPPSAPWPPSGVGDSQPVVAFHDASGGMPRAPSVPTVQSSRGSGLTIVLMLLIATMVGSVAFFVWRSGGVAGARARVTALWASDAPPITPPTLTASAAPSAVTSSTAPAETSTPQGTLIDTTTAEPTARHHTHHGTTPQATATNAPMQPVVESTQAQSATVTMQRPSQAQVQMAVGPLMRNARACLLPDDGESRALVTFQSDGSVKSVVISGFAAGKPQEACIKSAMARAKVDPFTDPTYGLPVTIRP